MDSQTGRQANSLVCAMCVMSPVSEGSGRVSVWKLVPPGAADHQSLHKAYKAQIHLLHSLKDLKSWHVQGAG